MVGLGARVTAAGARSYIYNYRVRGSGTQRRHTIGSCRDWTIGGARIEARRLRRMIDSGGDPLADLAAERDAPIMADLIERFANEHLPRRRASTVVNYRSMLDNYIRLALGRKQVADVNFDDIDKLHRTVTKEAGPYAGNRVVAVMSKMFSLAVRWNVRMDNPCKGIEKNKEHHRRRYLREGELPKLLGALSAYPDKRMADVFRVLLMTGARRGEVLSMRWADIDLAAGRWSKPPSSTKQKEQHEVPLSEPVKKLLLEIKQQQTAKRQALLEFVFPGSGSSGHVTELKKAWRRILKTAGIQNLRIHDLRHNFASQLASSGASLPLIGALLGHANPSTTARYSHLLDSPQRAAVERVGAVIGAAGKEETVDIKDIKGRGLGR